MKQPAILHIASGVAVGVALASWLPIWVSVLLAVALLWRVPGKFRTRWALVGLGLGIVRIIAAPLAPPPDDLVHQAGHVLELTGRVVGYPEQAGSRQKFVLAVEGLASGKAQVSADPYPKVATGDTVRLRGRIEPSPRFPDFDYRSWLARQGIHSTVRHAAILEIHPGSGLAKAGFTARQHFRERIDRLFPQPAAGFLQGILIGEREGMPDSLQSAFQRTGTVHVLALSGYNISIVVAAGVLLVGRTPWAIALVLLGLVCFVWLVGPSASVTRAALSGGLILLAQGLGRPQEALRICLVAAAALLLVSPWSLRYDLGFDLSFLATGGILLLEAPLRRRLTWLPQVLRPPISVTLAASLPTLPLIAASFGSVSVVSPLANLLLVPLVPWLMLGGCIAVALSIVSMALASALAVPVGLLAAAAIGAIRHLAALPIAQVSVASGIATLVISSILCGALVFRLNRATHA